MRARTTAIAAPYSIVRRSPSVASSRVHMISPPVRVAGDRAVWDRLAGERTPMGDADERGVAALQLPADLDVRQVLLVGGADCARDVLAAGDMAAAEVGDDLVITLAPMQHQRLVLRQGLQDALQRGRVLFAGRRVDRQLLVGH